MTLPIRLIIILLIDTILYASTNVASASSLVLMVGFISLLLTIYYLLRGLANLAAYYGLRAKRPKYFAVFFTVVIGCLISLQTIGELSIKDVAVLLPLGFLAYLYTSYKAPDKRPI